MKGKSSISNEELFKKLYKASNEKEVEGIIEKYPAIFDAKNWAPYGGNRENLGTIENQQASPIPALIEKITNSIDAILMKKCYEEGIDPKSEDAPRSMEEAVKTFFPNSNWDLPKFRKEQAESIQIIADGDKLKPSLIIYDDGEGQNPEDFEDTLLSLTKGNKNEIHFVQGKYNMGGSGAIVFCGKNKFHLIGSKRYDNKGDFGFTLIRKHPFNEEEKNKYKKSWYEYLKIDGKIPSFSVRDNLDLGLYNRRFKTGTILKLYNYDLPSGSRSVISRDLNQSLNEYLFEPALPIYTIDTKKRYSDDKNLERELFGLKRRLETSKKYIEDFFSVNIDDEEIGKIQITCYVFKTKIDDKNVKESKNSIQREFFKNKMSVLFSLNGQVHGSHSSAFISRSLAMPLIKDYTLIHVECTKISYEYRNELFMASRDRLKKGEESRKLDEKIKEQLKESKLHDYNKKRMSAIDVDSAETDKLIKSFSRNLPFEKGLFKLLGQTLKIKERKPKKAKKSSRRTTQDKDIPKFNPKRFPSYFKIDHKSKQGSPVIKIPFGGKRYIKFSTDVENHYFVRVKDPGELKLAILGYEPNEKTDGDQPGIPRKVQDIFNVVQTSPDEGKIKIVLNPTEKVQVGDSIKIKVTLTNPGNDYDQIFHVKISDPEKKTNKPQKITKEEPDDLGLPALIPVYKDENHAKENSGISWENLEKTGQSIDYANIMIPIVEDENLSRVCINLDSTVFRNYISKKNEQQRIVAKNRYLTSIYFHTIFLYSITKQNEYTLAKAENGKEESKEITEYLRDLFDHEYTQFLLNFEIQDIFNYMD